MLRSVFAMQFGVEFGRRYRQYLAAATGSLGILSAEMHFGWPSTALPVLTNGSYSFQISRSEASWLAVVIFPGIVFGALFSSFLADSLGRKKIILGTSVPLFVSWLLLALAKGQVLMFIARFLGGVGSGLSFATVPMYLGEISEPNIRGFLSSLCPIFVVLGILVINLLETFLPINITAFIASGVPLLMFCTFLWMPESPVLLTAQKRHEEARKALRALRGPQAGEQEFLRLSQDTEEASGGLGELFRLKANRKALFIALGLRSIQQICGSTAITFYCKTIFQETEELVSADVATIIYFSLQAVLAVFSSFVVDLLGRRPMFIFSLAGTTLTLFLAAFYMVLDLHSGLDLRQYQSVPVVALLLNVCFFSLGVRNVPLLVISEIFHPKIKPLALCCATIYYGVLAICVTKFYHVASEMVERSFPIFVFGLMSLGSLVVYCVYVPETKGKTLEEIQKMLKE